MPKTFTQIPLTRPATPLLDTLTSPAELRRLPATRLEQVVDELREYLLYAVGVAVTSVPAWAWWN